MANYLNIKNNSREMLSVQLVPKTQASTVHFKNQPPLNYNINEDGVMSFSLATTKIDRALMIAPKNACNIYVQKYNGVQTPDWKLTSIDEVSETTRVFSQYDLAQIGIGTLKTTTIGVIDGQVNPVANILMYNLSPNEVITLEGYVEDENQLPYMLTNHKHRAIFNDEDLAGAGLISDEEGNYAFCLGVSDRPFGTELSWWAPITDWDNNKLTGTIYLSLTVVRPGEDDVLLSHTETITRESIDDDWWNINFYDYATGFIDNFNMQFEEATGLPIPLFANAQDVDHGAMYLFTINTDGKNAPNAILPLNLKESIDGTWAEDDINVGGPIEMSAMIMSESGSMVESGDSMTDSMTDSMDGSMDGSMVERPINPYWGTLPGEIYVLISGTPLVNIAALSIASSGSNVDDNIGSISDEDIEDGMNQIYQLHPSQLIIHTANPIGDDELLCNLAHSTDMSVFDTYGEDNKDFRISSVGALNMSLTMSAPPPPGPLEPPVLS